jgi:hypothetical protein
VEHHSHYHTRHGEDKNKDQGHVIGGFKSWVLSSCHILFLPLVPPVPIGVKLGVNIRLMIVPWATQIPRKKPRNTLGKNWRRWALMLSDSQIVDGNMMEVRFCRLVAVMPVLLIYIWMQKWRFISWKEGGLDLPLLHSFLLPLVRTWTRCSN